VNAAQKSVKFMNSAQNFIMAVKVVSLFVMRRTTILIGNRALMIVKVSNLLVLCVSGDQVIAEDVTKC